MELSIIWTKNIIAGQKYPLMKLDYEILFRTTLQTILCLHVDVFYKSGVQLYERLVLLIMGAN